MYPLIVRLYHGTAASTVDTSSTLGAPSRQRLLDLLLECTVLMEQDMREHLEAIGLSEPRAHLLWVLDAVGPSTQRALAAALHISPRSVTALVDGLEATDFISRRPHPRDRRAVLVTPTPHARAVVAQLRDGHQRLADRLFGDLSEPESQTLHALLGGVTDRLRSLLAGGAERRGRDGRHGPGGPAGAQPPAQDAMAAVTSSGASSAGKCPTPGSSRHS